MKVAIIVNGRYRESEIEVRQKYFQSNASRGTEVGLFFPERFPLRTREERPPNSQELTALAIDVVEKAKEAEKKGYDAAVVYNSYDPGLEAAMGSVKIPVVGAGRAAYWTAAMLADKIIVIAPYKSFIPRTQQMASVLGFGNKVTTIRSLDIPVGQMATRKAEAKSKFIELARKGIEEGGQAVFPQGLNSLSVHVPVQDLGIGCPVMDAVPLAIRYAEMFVGLRLSQSKLAYPD